MSSRAYILAALLFGAFVPHNSVMAQNGPNDWQAAASKIVSRLALVRGERVLLVAVPGAADALVPVLREAIRAAGGTDLGAVAQQGAQPPAWSTDFTNELAKRTGSSPAACATSRMVMAIVHGSNQLPKKAAAN